LQKNKSTQERSDGGDAFIPESAQISGTPDDLAEFLGEQFLRGAVDDDKGEGSRDEEVTEELGGPFVESRAEKEFGPSQEGGSVGDSPAGAEESPTLRVRSPLPQAVGALAIAAPDEDGRDQVVEEDRNGRLLSGADARAATMGAESASSMEPVVKTEARSPIASRG